MIPTVPDNNSPPPDRGSPPRDRSPTPPGSSREPPASRMLDIAPERLVRWIEAFGDRHGLVTAEPGPAVAEFLAADGATARCELPFPPLALADGNADAASPLQPGAAAEPGDPQHLQLAGLIAAHAQADRTVGVLLVRLGGYAAGVFTGTRPALVASKVGSRLVHGRSAAGGQSQQRFARRREKQAREALSAAADTAAAVFEPFTARLDAVVLGGDRRAMSGLRADTRLGPFFEIAVERFLTVPDPRLSVLRETPRQFRAIRVRLTEPG
jgi:Actinobacteria/chloroflexi VLRF1 release factor